MKMKWRGDGRGDGREDFLDSWLVGWKNLKLKPNLPLWLRVCQKCNMKVSSLGKFKVASAKGIPLKLN